MSRAWRTSVALGFGLMLVIVTRGISGDENAPLLNAAATNDDKAETPKAPAKPTKKLFKGKVVHVTEALKRRGVKAYPEELKNQVVLESENGDLIPILPDWRGRAFYQDERLRNRNIELIGFQRNGIPYLNILSVYTFDDRGQRQFTDYWCDVCSIPMYEIKPCDCCQQDIRLRFQPQELPQDLDAAEPAKSISLK